MGIAENIRDFKALMPEGVEMVAVSKFHPVSAVMQAYNAGQRLFGESRVQEFLEKERELPKDIIWHFIGHLQTNKVKPIIGKVSLIESVDSCRLLELIDKESEKAGVLTDVLLQVHVAAEEAKFGFYPDELRELFTGGMLQCLKATQIRGIMGMATNTEDEKRIRADFAILHSLFLEIRRNLETQGSTGEFKECGCFKAGFDKLSMGMSGDWQIAISEGSNIVRIGSAIFGSRY